MSIFNQEFRPFAPHDFGGFFNSVGIHTANKYDVMICPTTRMSKVWAGLNYNQDTIQKYFNLTLVDLTIPNGAIATTAVRSYGEAVEMPYSKSYDSANFTHYLDNNGIVHELYTAWMNEVFDPYTRTMGYYTDYACKIEIKMYRRMRGDNGFYNEPFVVVTLEDAYPKAINPFSMQGLSGNAPTQFDVTMTCRRILTKYIPKPIRNAN